MSLTILTPPAAEPVTLTTVKDHLRLIDSSEDTKLNLLIKVARFGTESWLNRALITQTLVAKLDEFPDCRVIELERPPLQSVTSVQYIDQNYATQTLSSSNYTVDTSSSPGRIILKDGYSWPLTAREGNVVTVTYVAGYGADDTAIPSDISAALLLLIGHLYANREAVVLAPGLQQIDVPKTFEWLVGPYRIYS